MFLTEVKKENQLKVSTTITNPALTSTDISEKDQLLEFMNCTILNGRYAALKIPFCD